jgi:hypothetical protein
MEAYNIALLSVCLSVSVQLHIPFNFLSFGGLWDRPAVCVPVPPNFLVFNAVRVESKESSSQTSCVYYITMLSVCPPPLISEAYEIALLCLYPPFIAVICVSPFNFFVFCELCVISNKVGDEFFL